MPNGPLSVEERSSWTEDGFIHLRPLLTPDETTGLRNAVEEAVQRERQDGRNAALDDNGRGHTLRLRNAVAHTGALDSLLDHDRLHATLADLLGPDPRMLGSEIFIRRAGDSPLVRFHTDGGESLQRIQLSTESRALQLKVQIFLTDVSRPNRGNFVLIPGSHRQLPDTATPGCFIPEANRHLDEGRLPPGAVQVLAGPGDALVFPWSMWHAVAPNLEGVTRVSVILRFGQLWCAPHDHERQETAVLERLPERVRRMFGFYGRQLTAADLYRPDTPVQPSR